MSLKDWLNCVCTFEERRKYLFYPQNPNQSKFHQIVKEIAEGKKKIINGSNDRSSEYRRGVGGDSFSPFNASRPGEEGGGAEPGASPNVDNNDEALVGQNYRIYEPPGSVQEPPKEENESKGTGDAISSDQGITPKVEEVADLRGGGRVPKLNDFKRVGPRTRNPGGIKSNKKINGNR